MIAQDVTASVISPYLEGSLDYPLFFLVAGVLLLLLGRRLFWLFIAAAGFAAGLELAHAAMPHEPELVAAAAAVLLGLLGAVLAIFVQKIAVALAGFLGGGYLAATLYPSLAEASGAGHFAPWLLFAAGGVLGAILMTVFFNWALIILSALQGAHFILKGLRLEPLPLGAHRRHLGGGSSPVRSFFEHHGYGTMLFLVLAVMGVAVQAATYRRVPPREE